MRRPWRSRRQREEELRAEIEAHLRMAVADRVARGESPNDAERAARREFGNVDLVSESTREAWGGLWLDRLLRDVGYGLRSLWRSPGFAAAASLTLAIGVGANVAVFTVVNGVLLRPLPFERPQELHLVSYRETEPMFGAPPSMYEATYLEVRRQARTFESLASFAPAQLTLTGVGDPARLAAAMVAPSFMRVLGVDAALGRTFAEGEDTRGREHVVVLGDRLWRERFGARADVVGRPVTLDGVVRTVVGVMPPSFDFPFHAELWVPMLIELSPNRSWIRPVVGRLAAGATRDEAEREVEGIASAVEAPPSHEMVAGVTPLRDYFTAAAERSLLVFSGAVAFVLLIACANVANLQLIRGASRGHEILVRTALGASRARIVRQLLTESVIVALVGGVAGVLLSTAGVRALLWVAPAGRIPRVEGIRVDGVVLAVSMGVTLLAALLFGLAPALAATRQRLRGAMGEGTRTFGGRQEGLRRSLAVAEIAFTIVLLTGAGLLLRSFWQMRAVEPGFESEKALVMRLALPEAAYPDVTSMKDFHTAVLERLGMLPGVEHAGAVNWPPLGMQVVRGDFTVENAVRPRGWILDKMVATPGYFRAMGIDVLHGREFTSADDVTSPGVVLISRSVAERFWPPNGMDAVGKRMAAREDPTPEQWLMIVGVVEDVTQQAVTLGRGRAMYTPLLQTDRTAFLAEMTFVIRTEETPARIAPAVRAAVWDVDARLPTTLSTMNDVVSGTISEPRFEAQLLTAFAVLSLLLAAVGIYGVLAHDVTSRTREIGLRMALGARRAAIRRMVLGRVLRVAAPGVALGLIGALVVTRVLSRSLFEVTPLDPITFATVAATLVGVALLASIAPARRAASVDPMVALRQE